MTGATGPAAGSPAATSELPPLGLGCAQLGNLTTPMSEDTAHSLVHRALEAGCHYLDTAPHYGVGLSEERLGRALSGVPRKRYLLSTKAGRRLRPLAAGEHAEGEGFVNTPPRARFWDFSADGIRRGVAESLHRLGTDHVDIVYLHDAESHLRTVYDEGFPALARLRDEGVVHRIGFGMNHSGVLARLVADLEVDVVLCAGRWTLLDRTAQEDLLPVCARRGTRMVAAGVYNSGLLADARPGAHYDYRPAPAALLERARRIEAVCARHGVPLRAAALHFPFRHPAVHTAVVGAATPDEVQENVRLFRQPVPAALWHELAADGLLGTNLPDPGEEPGSTEDGAGHRQGAGSRTAHGERGPCNAPTSEGG